MPGLAQVSAPSDAAALAEPAAGGYRLAYVSRVVYPDQTANALQTLHMASALALQLGEGCLFVHDLALSEADVRRQYGTPATPLRLVPLRTGRWPKPVYNNGPLRFGLYNSAVAAHLALHPAWRSAPARPNVLFVRSRLEILYWGRLRPYLAWLRSWRFVCEVHDLQLPVRAGAEGDYDERSDRAKRFARALGAYDHVLAVTQGLAEDVQTVTRGAVTARVVPLSTGLERLDGPPAVALGTGPIVLGYVGTLDARHGIEDCLLALRLLPDRFQLRLVGRADDLGQLERRVAELGLSGRVRLVPPVPYRDVAATLDRLDLVLAPAGANTHSLRHRSPLKIFDYMARGKPIVAADVPCHREILHEGISAALYRCGEAADLAAHIQRLADCPAQAQVLAQAAWRQSASHTYAHRARQIHAILQQPSARQPRGLNKTP